MPKAFLRKKQSSPTIAKAAKLMLAFCSCCLLPCACRQQEWGTVVWELSGSRNRNLAVFEISARQGSRLIDSVRIDPQGKGEFRLPDDSLRLYAFAAQGNANLLFLTGPVQGTLQVSAAYDSLAATVLVRDGSAGFQEEAKGMEGNTANKALVSYQKQVNATGKAWERIDRYWSENCYRVEDADALYARCRHASDSLFQSLKQEAERLCLLHTGSLLPVFVFNKTLGNHLVFDLENDQDRQFMYRCAKAMQKELPANAHVERLMFNLDRIEAYKQYGRLQEQDRQQEQIRQKASAPGTGGSSPL